MASNRLRIAAIAALLAALTAIGCTAETEQPSVSERVIDCNIERTIGDYHGPEEQMFLHAINAFEVAEDDPHSDEWRCALLEAARYARSVTQENGFHDGAIFAVELEAAAYARTWTDAQLPLGDAWFRSMGPEGIKKFHDYLDQSIAEHRRYTEQYRQWSPDEQD